MSFLKLGMLLNIVQLKPVENCVFMEPRPVYFFFLFSEMCEYNGSSHQVTFVVFLNHLFSPVCINGNSFSDHRHDLSTEADCGVCCASQVFLRKESSLW